MTSDLGMQLSRGRFACFQCNFVEWAYSDIMRFNRFNSQIAKSLKFDLVN